MLGFGPIAGAPIAAQWKVAAGGGNLATLVQVLTFDAQNISAAQRIAGLVNEVLPALPFSGIANLRTFGGLSAALYPVAALGTAALRVSAALDAQLPPAAVFALGRLGVRAQVQETLAALGVSALGYLSSGTMVAALEQVLGPLGLSATATLELRAAVDAALAAGLAASGKVRTWPRTPFATVAVPPQVLAPAPLLISRTVRLP